MKRILILGSTGMVGSELFHYLSSFNDLEVFGTYHSYHKPDLNYNKFYFDCLDIDLNSIKFEFMRYDYIINCIMASVDVRPMTDEERKRQLLINSHFPLWLSNAVSERKSVKIINISSDAVFSGKKACGSYDEFSFPDPNCLYGLSKFLGESSYDNVLNIRTSFLGRDPRSGRGLIELVVRSEEGCKLVGYTDYIWSGVTTKQFGVLINHIIEEDLFCALRSFSHVLNYSCNEPISKYSIISMIKEISGREDILLSSQPNPGGPINRSITSSCGLLSKLNARQSTLGDSLKEILNEKF